MAEQPAHDWRTTLKRRLAVAAVGCLLLWAVAIEARLVYLQVVQHAELSARAERQQLRTVDAPAKRGEILDRHGRLLAYSVDADTIYAVPTEIDDRRDGRRGAVRRARRLRRARIAQALAERIRSGRVVRLRAPAGVAGSGAARRRARARRASAS